MSDLKITIDHLKNYLGTGLKIQHPFNAQKIWELDVLGADHDNVSISSTIKMNAKPICYRLSDLDKFIPELGFVPIEEIEIELMRSWCSAYDEFIDFSFPFQDLNQAPFEVFQQFVKWHFWAFGENFFEQGLVIDKMTIQKP